MFEKGEFIVYGTTGVCKVVDITTMELSQAPKDKLFYVLEPEHQKGSRIFTPVDNHKVVMRKVLTKEEAEALVDSIPDIESLWIENEKMREETFKTGIRGGDCREWIKIIKNLYLKKQERLLEGKKFPAADERYLKMAQGYLHAELSVSLDMPEEKVENYIGKRLNAWNPV